MRTRTRTAAAGALGASVLITALIVGPQEPAEAVTAEPLSGEARHCWHEVDTGRSLCGETPDALATKMFAQYGVLVRERPGEHLPEGITGPSERLEAKLPASPAGDGGQPRGSTYILIKGYSEKSYGGYSVIWTQALSQRPCISPGNYSYGQIEYMHNFNFNDKMRSYQVATGCRLNVYKDTKFRGNVRGPYGDSKSLGILDREVSSMSLRG